MKEQVVVAATTVGIEPTHKGVPLLYHEVTHIYAPDCIARISLGFSTVQLTAKLVCTSPKFICTEKESVKVRPALVGEVTLTYASVQKFG